MKIEKGKSKIGGSFAFAFSLFSFRRGLCASVVNLFCGCTGCSGGLQPGTSTVRASAEFFGSFTPAPSMNDARTSHTATLLQDGRVLVAGGSDAGGKALQTAEVFDPTFNGFSLASATLSSARQNHAAALL